MFWAGFMVMCLWLLYVNHYWYVMDDVLEMKNVCVLNLNLFESGCVKACMSTLILC
mgnify:CR=1 FL=1